MYNNNNNTKKSLGACTPTTCPKVGIKIHESNNEYKKNPFEDVKKSKNIQNTTLGSLDLDLDHYELNDLLNLFNMDCINENNLKNAKQIVLKMHPDKSKLDAKYFLFFSSAYKRIYGVYEFQNKSLNKKYKDEEFYEESNVRTLNDMFEKNKKLKDPTNFNSWFNEQFDKHKLDDDEQHGYGDWLKSNDGIMDINEKVTKTNMNEIFEKIHSNTKEEIRPIIPFPTPSLII
jgi:hypothetical protein